MNLLETIILITYLLHIVNGQDVTHDKSHISRQSRYSYFWTIEYYCTDKCRANGKPFGRLLGTVCSCYCPMDDTVDACTGDATMSCSLLCKKNGYTSGYCLYHDICFCYCRPRDKYNPSNTTFGSAIIADEEDEETTTITNSNFINTTDLASNSSTSLLRNETKIKLGNSKEKRNFLRKHSKTSNKNLYTRIIDFIYAILFQ